MNKSSMSSLLQSLEDVEEKISLLKLYDEENYNYYSKKILALRQGLINLEDDKDLISANAGPIIEGVAHLELEIDNFMKHGETKKDEEELQFGEDNLSGEERAKQHAVGVFRELAEVVGGMTEIDIERLKTLKKQWEEEKVKYNYSEAEMYAIEEALANAFIEYQIKTCAKEGRLPTEERDKICDQKFYEKMLKKRIVDYAASLPKGTLERLDLESYCINWNLDTILKSKAVWKGLSGVEPEFLEIEQEEIVQEEQPSKAPSNEPKQDNPQNLPLNLNEEARGNAVLVVYEKVLPDGTVEHKRKIKQLDEDGRFKLFFNKDKVVELYFLEGTEQLRFTKGGDSKSAFSHLSDFPNLRNVYLPSSLRIIEQGYFLNCDNLNNVFLGKGTYYKPNQQLFPSKTKIKESEEKTNHSVVINEPEEKSAIFTQVSSTGQKTTIKVGLSGSLLPKSFVRKGIPGLEEVRYTRGVDDIGYSYWTNEYESTLIQGGKYGRLLGLKRVIMPEGLKHMDESVFSDCTSLEEVYMPDGVTKIPRYAFKNCPNLKNIRLSDTIKRLERYAFIDCKSLKDIRLPLALEVVEENVFENCEGIESVQFPKRLSVIGADSFKNCSRLTNLKFQSERVGRIDRGAFENCAGLKTLCMPDETDYIVFDAFKNCVRLESVLLPRSFEHFEAAFPGCQSLRYGIDQSKMTEEEAAKIFPGNYFIKLFKAGPRPDNVEPEVFLAEEVKKAKEKLIKHYSGKSEPEKKEPETEEKTQEDSDSENIEK